MVREKSGSQQSAVSQWEREFIASSLKTEVSSGNAEGAQIAPGKETGPLLKGSLHARMGINPQFREDLEEEESER